MGVFTPNTIYDLQMQVHKLAGSFFDTRPLVLTPQEFIDGFIAPEHIAMLKEAEDICGRIGNTGATSWEAITSDRVPISFNLTFTGGSPIIMPNYVGKGLHNRAPDELRARVQRWVDERYMYGCIFGDVYDAISSLNEICFEAKSMTVMLPILPTLLRNITPEADSRTSKRARRLSEMRGVSAVPSLPRAVSKRVHECCHLLTAVNMIDTVPSPKVEPGGSVGSFHNHGGANCPSRRNLFAGINGLSKTARGSFL